MQIIFFAASAHEPTVLFDLLIPDLAATGLFLNAHKTVTLTNEAQPLSQCVLSNGQVIQMECGEYGHRRWLGCILGVGRFHRTSLDAEFHLHAASRAFFAN